MDIAHYLAMTAAEIGADPPLPAKIAWMACHFSPSSTGLSNCPSRLPPGSLLILDDASPICGHSRTAVADRLLQCVDTLKCGGVLLDFQRPGSAETAALAQYLAENLSCPLAVSSLYAEVLSCPVFLPPAPVQIPVKDYLAPWQGRQIWLETALDGVRITLTKQGAAYVPLSWAEEKPGDFRDDTLLCRYRVGVRHNSAEFLLYRAREDLEDLLEEAQRHGVTAAVGLYQEWVGTRPQPFPPPGQKGTPR